MKKSALLTLLFALTAVDARADIVWTGAVDDDIFNEANWDLSGSTVTAIDPNVTIDDDVVIANAAVPVVFPDIPSQVRFQLADTRTLTIDNSIVLVANNDGFGGVPGTTNGPTVQLHFVSMALAWPWPGPGPALVRPWPGPLPEILEIDRKLSKNDLNLALDMSFFPGANFVERLP